MQAAKPAAATQPAPALNDTSALPDAVGQDGTTDWSRSYSGLSVQPFPKEAADVLLAPVDPLDIEIKPGAFELRLVASLAE